MKIEAKHKHEIHHPPSRLLELVDRRGGPPLEEMVAAAEEDIALLVDEYPASIETSIARMRQALAMIETGGHRTIFKEAFDMKGLASTLKQPLLGELARWLCDVTHDHPADDEKRHQLIEVYIDAIAWTLAHQVREASDPRAGEMLAELEEARGKK